MGKAKTALFLVKYRKLIRLLGLVVVVLLAYWVYTQVA